MEKKIELLMVSGQYPIGPKPRVGGGGAHVHYLARALVETGRVSVTLLTGGNECSVVEVPGLEIISSPILSSKQLRYDDAISLKERLQTRKIQIVHGHHYDGGFVGKRMASLMRVPFVLTMHKPPRITKVRRDYHLSDSDHARWREFATDPIVKANIAYSEAYKQELSRFGAPNICKILHGVPVEYLQSEVEMSGESDRYIGAIPRGNKIVVCPMRPEKPGLESFILAAHLIFREFPRVTFIVTGNPNSGNRAHRNRVLRLMRLGSCLGVGQHTMRFAELPLKYMWRLMRRADVIVLPSLREGLSIALLEAMSLGRPIVAFDAPGIEEAIVHGESGLLCEPGKEEHFARSVLSLMKDQNLAARLASNALVRARNEFHAKRMAHEYIALYERLINDTGAKCD